MGVRGWIRHVSSFLTKETSETTNDEQRIQFRLILVVPRGGGRRRRQRKLRRVVERRPFG